MSKLKGSLSSSEEIITLSGTLESASSLQGTLANYFLRGLSAYQEAQLEGFEGTRSDWLESLKGEEVLLRENGNNIEWKYKSSDEWQYLISLEATKDYNLLINKPTLDGSSLSGSIDKMVNNRIDSQVKKITSNEDFALTNMDIENLLT